MASAFDTLGETIEGLIKGIQQKWRESENDPGVLDSLRGFLAAIDWRVGVVPNVLLSCWTA